MACPCDFSVRDFCVVVFVDFEYKEIVATLMHFVIVSL